jgi:hypothetical protein
MASIRDAIAAGLTGVADALGPAKPAKADAGTELAGLGSAVQAFVSFAALLPITGTIVLLIEYLTVSTIPGWLAFSESLGGLAWRGWIVMLVVLGPLIAVWLAPFLMSVGEWAKVQSPVTTPQGRVANWLRDLVKAPHFVRNARIVFWAIVALVALVVPFPHVTVAVLVMAGLGSWFLRALRRVHEAREGSDADKEKARRASSTQALALRAVAAWVLAVAAIGLAPNGGQLVYVATTQTAVVHSGWYIKLTDSTSPVFLLTCDRNQVVSLPSSDIALVTYTNGGLTNTSLLDLIGAHQWPHLGLTPACPASPPPSP